MLDFHGSWDRNISLMKFSYNNNYQSSIGMTPMKLCMEENVELLYVGQN